MTDWDRFLPSADRALVTGAGSGMGKAVALRLARAGVKVYVVGRREDALAATAAAAKPGAIVPLSADIRDPDRIDAMFTTAEEDGGVVPLLSSTPLADRSTHGPRTSRRAASTPWSAPASTGRSMFCGGGRAPYSKQAAKARQ